LLLRHRLLKLQSRLKLLLRLPLLLLPRLLKLQSRLKPLLLLPRPLLLPRLSKLALQIEKRGIRPVFFRPAFSLQHRISRDFSKQP
jgi:hypothetical protein